MRPCPRTDKQASYTKDKKSAAEDKKVLHKEVHIKMKQFNNIQIKILTKTNNYLFLFLPSIEDVFNAKVLKQHTAVFDA